MSLLPWCWRRILSKEFEMYKHRISSKPSRSSLVDSSLFSLHHTFQWVIGQWTRIALSKAWFCAHWTIFVGFVHMIWINPLLEEPAMTTASWQREQKHYSLLKLSKHHPWRNFCFTACVLRNYFPFFPYIWHFWHSSYYYIAIDRLLIAKSLLSDLIL